MIKATSVLNGRRAVILGLSRKNTEALLEGKPMKIDLAELGMPEAGVVFIVGGETEQSIQAELAKYFVMPQEH
jgi:hypothetical protein